VRQAGPGAGDHRAGVIGRLEQARHDDHLELADGEQRVLDAEQLVEVLRQVVADRRPVATLAHPRDQAEDPFRELGSVTS
jgi:hypothetical protein